MNDTDRRHLPIGYWLKRADELLTARIDAAQRENGLTRLAWQALNVVRDAGEADSSHIAAILSPFASAIEVHGVLDTLRRQGHLEASDGHVRLTASGSEVFERARSAQKVIREGAFAGIEQRDYETAMEVLRRLVQNLERGDAA